MPSSNEQSTQKELPLLIAQDSLSYIVFEYLLLDSWFAHFMHEFQSYLLRKINPETHVTILHYYVFILVSFFSIAKDKV